MFAATPVPPLTTPRSMSVTWAAIPGSTTCSHLGFDLVRSSRTSLSRSTTLAMEYGSQRTPLLASTAKALAMSSTLVLPVPSTDEQMFQWFAYASEPFVGTWIPIRLDTSTALLGLTMG